LPELLVVPLPGLPFWPRDPAKIGSSLIASEMLPGLLVSRSSALTAVSGVGLWLPGLTREPVTTTGTHGWRCRLLFGLGMRRRANHERAHACQRGYQAERFRPGPISLGDPRQCLGYRVKGST
jgi:hypothetical protein